MALLADRGATALRQGLASLAGDVLELARKAEAHVLVDHMHLAHRHAAGVLEGFELPSPYLYPTPEGMARAEWPKTVAADDRTLVPAPTRFEPSNHSGLMSFLSLIR